MDVGSEYNAYDGWYHLLTTSYAHDHDDGSLKDEVYQWIFEQFCFAFNSCPDDGVTQENPDLEGIHNILYQFGWNKHPDDEYIINFDSIPEMVYDIYFCYGSCYDVDAQLYDGTTPYIEAQAGVDYNIGQGANGGQFFIFMWGWRYVEAGYTNVALLNDSEGELRSFYFEYFNYFGSNYNEWLPIFYNPSSYV